MRAWTWAAGPDAIPSMATAPPLGVRDARPSDGSAIGEAHAAAWLQAYREFFDPGFLRQAAAGRRAGWPHAIERILTEDALLLVGTLDGAVTAFAHAGPSHHDSGVGEVLGFYSHPMAWGTGLAFLLMTETCSRLTGRWDRVILWTHRDAGRARHFYEKAGFRATGGERFETFSDWIGTSTAEVPTVEYARQLIEPATPTSTRGTAT